MAAFAGESEARNKYTYYASKAKKDGYVQIAQLFEETAANEKEHAKIWFKILHGGAVGGTGRKPAGCSGRGKLRMDGYVPHFCQRSAEEGFHQIAALDRVERNTKNGTASCSRT